MSGILLHSLFCNLSHLKIHLKHLFIKCGVKLDFTICLVSTLLINVVSVIGGFFILSPNFVVNVFHGVLHDSGVCGEFEVFKNNAIIVCNTKKPKPQIELECLLPGE